MDFSQLLYMKAELSLLAVIVILFVADLFMCADGKRKSILNTSFPVILLAIHTLHNLLPASPFSDTCTMQTGEAFGGMYLFSPMMTLVKSVLNIGTIVVFLMAHQWLARQENLVKQGEFYLVTLLTLLGMYFMISSGHFLMFFIGLELASVPMAALVAFDKHRYESAEAAAKFILLALFSAALLLYGLSFVYGATGTLYFSDIDLSTIISSTPLLILGLLLFLTGMGFKLSLVPFHLWTADTYEGAPTVVTGYLSVISKGAAAFTLMVILLKAFSGLSVAWNEALVWLIITSITVANLFAIRQKNLKRFMAFSAISQAGYIVLAMLDGTAQGMTSLVYYIFVYMAANLGAFAVMNSIEQSSGKIGMDDYNGLYTTNPKLAFLMTLCLFSLAGIPPFAGFFSKFFVFMAAFQAGYHWVVLVALINTVISLYYYLLIVKAMYINKNDAPISTFRSDCYSRTAYLLCLIGVLLIGVIGAIYTYIDQFSFGM